MSQLQTEGRIEGRTDGRTDRPSFIGPFCPRPGIQKVKRQHGKLNKKNTLWVKVLKIVTLSYFLSEMKKKILPKKFLTLNKILP